MRQKCSLILSSGQRFEGQLIGAPIKSSGQLVFTTGMVGYSEAITDPSYFGQILAFTYPLIGNYGIPENTATHGESLPRGFESWKPQASAVILTVDSPDTFHWRSFQSLDEWLKKHNVPGIVGLDTRHLVHLIRSTPNLLGKIVPEDAQGEQDLDPSFTLAEDNFFDPGLNTIIDHVSVKEPKTFGNGSHKITIVDCGIKWNIVRQLLACDCTIELVPWDYDFNKVETDGWLISNGPGDPTRTGQLREKIQGLFSSNKPILGICLGHQLICLAAGAETTRMAYGHRSHNQPVYQVGTRKGFITTQNHGYVVEDNTVQGDWEPWFRNANDQSIEGIRHKTLPIKSVQFHPESAGGPRDTAWILEDFVAEVKGENK